MLSLFFRTSRVSAEPRDLSTRGRPHPCQSDDDAAHHDQQRGAHRHHPSPAGRQDHHRDSTSPAAQLGHVPGSGADGEDRGGRVLTTQGACGAAAALRGAGPADRALLQLGGRGPADHGQHTRWLHPHQPGPVIHRPPAASTCHGRGTGAAGLAASCPDAAGHACADPASSADGGVGAGGEPAGEPGG